MHGDARLSAGQHRAGDGGCPAAGRDPACNGSWPAFHVELGSSSVSSDPTPSAPAYSNQDMLNDLQRTIDANNAATDQNNAAMAAATQTEVLFNTVYFPPNN